jgi:hypothetical protein
VHVIPQRASESLALHGGRRADDAELGRIAAAIAAALDARSGAP